MSNSSTKYCFVVQRVTAARWFTAHRDALSSDVQYGCRVLYLYKAAGAGGGRLGPIFRTNTTIIEVAGRSTSPPRETFDRGIKLAKSKGVLPSPPDFKTRIGFKLRGEDSRPGPLFPVE